MLAGIPCRFIHAEDDDNVVVGVYAGTLVDPDESALLGFDLE